MTAVSPRPSARQNSSKRHKMRLSVNSLENPTDGVHHDGDVVVHRWEARQRLIEMDGTGTNNRTA